MRPSVLWCIAVASLAACVGGMPPGDDAGPVDVQFVTPGAGASFTRDQLAPNGALVATVTADVAVTGPAARVGMSIGGVDLADADASGHAVVLVPRTGTLTLVATAYDGTGAAAATAEVEIDVADPELADCQAWLDLYGVTYTAGPTNPGVDDPVTATVPINGMTYRYVDNTTPRTKLFADCSLILSLAKAAPLFRDRGVTEVADIGVYNYRCIGGGTPPDCPNGISQHAYAKAIDLAGFTYGAGDYASVNDDFVIDPDDEPTCSAATEPGKDAFLHELICALKAAEVWTIVLTPNYNADHRNHFHVDLTPDADFIRSRGRVDHGPDNH